jgi:molybdate transport repressor ModE-like protein
VVARTGSISVACLQVGRTQSALSMQMQRLEDLIGQPLLHRSGSGVRLTTTGERLLSQPRRFWPGMTKSSQTCEERA